MTESLTVNPAGAPTIRQRCLRIFPPRWGERCSLQEGHDGECVLEPAPRVVVEGE